MNVGVIGCGAVTEVYHLPTLASAVTLQNVVLIDKFIKRARSLASRFGIPRVATDHREVLKDVDVVIIATPHTTHAAIAIDCLGAGKDVLCEKPICVSTAQCSEMIHAAETSGKTLGVGLMRRQSPAYREAARILHEQELGRPLRFVFREGGVLNWPISSPAFWSKQAAGGGVLLDTGPHTLDLLTWWLGEWEHVDYRDDNLGNVEANCQLKLTLKNGATGIVELSRTHNPGQQYLVECERGFLEAIPHKFNLLRIYHATTARYEQPRFFPEVDYPWLFRAQWAAFTAAVTNQQSTVVRVEECVSAIRLIETCYRQRQPLQMLWIAP